MERLKLAEVRSLLGFVRDLYAVRDLNGENLWGVNGGLDPAIAEFTADLNMRLGNLPVAVPAKDLLDPRFVEAALKKLGTYQEK